MAITAEQLLEFMKEQAYKPMTYQELEAHFELADAAEFRELLKVLTGLEEQGEIVRTRSNRYGVPDRMNLLRGKIQVHAKGFGFLLPDDPEHPDVYIHANDLKGAMNGDKILARVTGQKDGGKLEGEVARIVQRANTQIVGLYQDHGSFGFVIPDDRRIGKDLFVPKESSMGAVSGHKVVVDIVQYPQKRAAAEGQVVEILGHQNDPGVDILSIIRKYGIPEKFSPEVMREAEQIGDTVREDELAERRDLRNRTIVTIDGADAKDLDDAVEVERLDNGNIRLGVHIADVGYYVKENSRLDREAYRRGCSVYLIDRVIPMLPHRLSNGICSLNPQVDRLTLSCEMEINSGGRVVSHEIFPSVIRTVERMTYEDVRKILLDEDPEITAKYAELVDFFKLMETLAMTLRKNRMGRGAIDFDFQEAKVLVNEEGDPIDIVKQDRSIAEQLIEEFMLAANETVAEHFFWLKAPFLYRIHEDPDSEKLQYFMEFITNFGLTVRGKGNKVHPRALQTLLDEVKGTKEETVISKMMLRSMKQAKYDAENRGHFGLSAEYYTHFTSPIRRYPDLVIHRIIRELFVQSGSISEKRRETLEKAMEDIARQSSERERLAEDAERETEDLKKAEYMVDKVGEEFEGIVSGVTSFGIFVELDNTVEGLIRLSDMHDDYYHFHERHMALIGERTSKIFRIGDEVTIRVKEVVIEERQIDFELVDVKPRDGTSSAFDDALLARSRGKAGSKPKKGKSKNSNTHQNGKQSVPDGEGGFITTANPGKKRRKRKGKQKGKKKK